MTILMIPIDLPGIVPINFMPLRMARSVPNDLKPRLSQLTCFTPC